MNQLTFINDAKPPDPRKVAETWVPTIRDLPVRERPVNRLYHAGEGALSATELLAIVLGTPNALVDAGHLLKETGHLYGLSRANLAEIEAYPGIGRSLAARVKASQELGRRIMLARPEDRYTVRSPADVSMLLMSEMSHLQQEHFRVILLDTRNRLLRAVTVYIGSLNASHIRIGEIFRHAITENAAAIIAVHNHPSGDPTPSPEDVNVTRSIREAGDLIDIELLDHLIIGAGRFVSLKERGLGFS